MRSLVFLSAIVAAALLAPSAHADPGLALHGEGAAAHLVGPDKASQFGWGASGAIDAELRLGRMIGFSLGGAVLGLSSAEGDPRFAASGSGSAIVGRGGVRLRPFAFGKPSAVDRIWIAGGGGVADTGGLARPEIDARAGFDASLGAVGLGPYVGLLQIVEPHKQGPRNEDARALLVGVHLELDVGKKRPAPPKGDDAPPPPRSLPTIDDADHDGAPIAIDHDPDPRTDPPRVRMIEARTVIIERVHFFIDKATIDTRSLPRVAAIARMLLDHPEIERVIVEGHADDMGSDEYNLKLSAARARSVRAEFVRLGVAADRLGVESFGKSRPRARGTTYDARQQNRRVELNIVRRRDPADGRSASNEGGR